MFVQEPGICCDNTLLPGSCWYICLAGCIVSRPERYRYMVRDVRSAKSAADDAVVSVCVHGVLNGFRSNAHTRNHRSGCSGYSLASSHHVSMSKEVTRRPSKTAFGVSREANGWPNDGRHGPLRPQITGGDGTKTRHGLHRSAFATKQSAIWLDRRYSCQSIWQKGKPVCVRAEPG